MAIYPRNYDEVMRFKRCQMLKLAGEEIDDELVEKAYQFLGEHPENKVSVSNEMLCFFDMDKNAVFSMAMEHIPSSITSIELTGLTLSIMRPYVSGDGGDGGSSGNNNNNNNNNNG